MNLQKGDPTMMRRPLSPMVKSAQDEEEKVESFAQLELTYLVGDLPNFYRVWFTNLLLFLGIKSLTFRDKISSSLSRINLPRNKGFGNSEIR